MDVKIFFNICENIHKIFGCPKNAKLFRLIQYNLRKFKFLFFIFLENLIAF